MAPAINSKIRVTFGEGEGVMAEQAEERDPDFFRLVLDSMTEHIAVIDTAGAIVYVNRP